VLGSIPRKANTHIKLWSKSHDDRLTNGLALCDKMSRSVSRLDKSIPRNLSFNELFHFSELLESYGMLELNSGNSKKAKNTFKRAWINPTENVITHGEWVIEISYAVLRGEKIAREFNFTELLSLNSDVP